jgi:intergrase/recombinase
LSEKKINPGEQAYLYHVPEEAKPQVLASASRVYEEKVEKKSYAFVVRSPLNTTNVLRVLLPAEPQKVTVVDGKGKSITDVKTSWDAGSKTSFLSFENDPDGIKVKFEWR